MTTILLIAAAAVAFVWLVPIPTRYWSVPGSRSRGRWLWTWKPIAKRAALRRAASRKKHPDCVEDFCGSRGTHRKCEVCGKVTCSYTVGVDEANGRRRGIYVCHKDRQYGGNWDTLQRDVARARRLADLEKVTVPADDSHLRYTQMPDQYPGPTRDAIRALLNSDATEAVVEGVSAAALNGSLAATGLDDRMYAEQRGDETVLRKVE